MRLRWMVAVVALGWGGTAGAGGKKDRQLPADIPVFRVAYPDGLALEETVERTRVKDFDGTSQSETTRQVSDLAWSAVPGGWELRSTLRTATVTRNGAPASDMLAELMIGLPVTFRFDPTGTVTGVTGFEPLAARLDAFGVGADLRELLDRTLDPALLAEKARLDLESRLGVLSGQPLAPGLRIERPGPQGTSAAWTLAGTAPCPPGTCVEATSELPLVAGTLDLGTGISATLDSGTVRGTLWIDPATSLPWREVRDDERVMSVSISGRTSQGTVRDHIERTWVIVEN